MTPYGYRHRMSPCLHVDMDNGVSLCLYVDLDMEFLHVFQVDMWSVSMSPFIYGHGVSPMYPCGYQTQSVSMCPCGYGHGVSPMSPCGYRHEVSPCLHM